MELEGSQTSSGERADRSAQFDRYYSSYARPIAAYLARRLAPDEVEDAAAEVFLIAWKRMESIPPGHALPWLYRVAGNVVANHRRSTRRYGVLQARLGRQRPSASEFELPAARLTASENARGVSATLQRLSPRDREIVCLAAWEQLDRDQLAAALGVTRSAIDKRLSRARAKLRVALAAERSGVESPVDLRQEANTDSGANQALSPPRSSRRAFP